MAYQKPNFLIRFEKFPAWEHLGSGTSHVRFESPKGVKIIGFNIGDALIKHGKTEGESYLLVELDRETWRDRESVVVQVRDILKLSS